jgi:hypothetical protein
VAAGDEPLCQRSFAARIFILSGYARQQSTAADVGCFNVAEDSLSTDMAKDIVHNADKRLYGIDYDAIDGYVFF